MQHCSGERPADTAASCYLYTVSERERARGLEMQFLPKPVLWCSVPSAGTTPCYNLSTKSHPTVLIAAEPGLAGPGPGLGLTAAACPPVPGIRHKNQISFIRNSGI